MKSRWNMHSNLRLRLSISNTSITIIQCKTTAAANELQNLKLKLAESRDEQKMTIVDVARSKKAWKTLCWNWNFITDQMYQVMFFSYPFTVKNLDMMKCFCCFDWGYRIFFPPPASLTHWHWRQFIIRIRLLYFGEAEFAGKKNSLSKQQTHLLYCESWDLSVFSFVLQMIE